ncbi:hypothetical protein [Devosia sp.]|uniref:hypothetical protein n=1 Tax=Devosia sp. TaxID=1871048 RepID=UPI003263EEF3
MFSAVATEPVSSTANVVDYRLRSPGLERTILPESTKAAPSSPNSGEGQFPQGDKPKAQERQPEPQAGTSTMFAAAVIAGALAPRPHTMTELYRRIGMSPIPPESEAKLRNLTA